MHISGRNYSGGMTKKEIPRLFHSYRHGLSDIGRQVGGAFPLDPINHAFEWYEESVLTCISIRNLLLIVLKRRDGSDRYP